MQSRVLLLGLICCLLAGASVSAVSSFTGVSSSYESVVRPDFQDYYSSESRLQTYWPILTDPQQCTGRQDIILQVSPAGCQPAVVRSDLLGDQNVPVFCQLDALTLNPLLDVKSIDTITFSGNYPKEIVGSGFHPARAALLTHDRLLGDPIINNIGYVVVVLKKQPDERQLPDKVNVTLTATIRYDADNAFGVGRAEFLLEQQTDTEWGVARNRQSFWNGQFAVRLEDADADAATVAFYQGDHRISSIRVRRGETSREFFLPGLYCQAGLQVAYDGFVAAETTALLQVDDEVVQVSRGAPFLNGKCRVSSVNRDVTGDSVDISCSGRSYRLSLQARQFAVGDKVQLTGADDPWTIVRVVNDTQGPRYLINKSSAAGISNEQRTEFGAALQLSSFDGLIDRQYDSGLEQSFGQSIKGYNQVADQYGSERDNAVLQTTYGQRALEAAFDLSQKLGKDKTAYDFVQRLAQEYPETANSSFYDQSLARLGSLDSSESSVALYIDGETKVVSLLGLREPKERPHADFIWGEVPQRIRVAERNSTNVNGIGNISIDTINVGSARGRVVCANGNVSSFSLTVDGTGQVFCDRVLKLDDAALGSQAKVRLLPSVKNVESVTNFSVVVGIEKRALELTPDKAKKRVDELNKTIAQWEGISNNIGNAVKGLKTACFATAGVLTVKNFFTGLSGEGLARQKVMRDYWNVKCADLVNSGEYGSLGECYYQKSDEIDRDVSVAQKAIEAENAKIKAIESQYSTPVEGIGSVFGEKIVDRNKSVNDFVSKELLPAYGDQAIALPNGQSKKVSELVQTNGGYDRGEYSYDEVRDMKLNLDIINSPDASPGLKEAAQRRLQDTGKSVYDNTQLSAQLAGVRQDQSSGLPTFYSEALAADSRPTRYAAIVPTDSVKIDDVKTKLAGSDYVTRVVVRAATPTIGQTGHSFDAGEYEIGLSKNGNNYVPQTVLKKTATGYEPLPDSEKNAFLNTYNLGSVQSFDQVTYNNKYVDPKIRYYETEPFKGLPAIVPFDTQRGWYAATKQSLPTFGGIGSFDASGKVSSLWICNVGANGQEQFYESIGDDICQQVNLNTGQPIDQFPGLEPAQAQRLIARAVDAVQQASQQYASGKKVIQIRGLSGTETLAVGSPAASIPASQCQNFMSPDECRLLFNVCDPVICPSSRCDLGGAYPVADVIQTGIVGSALLCLPNVREGIYLPVCLTGIKAGIDGYLSILKSHQQCLQENLASGKYVGICDEITAVYTCEFFWRQVAPAANVLLPKLVEVATGQVAPHGGGEYLTVSSAYQHAQDSVNFFTQTYAVNSLEAFKIRSVEDAGTSFCKAFISAKGPSSFEALVEPDSPAQFHAWFSSTTFTTATVPASAQYKVFYHIFAGNDLGVSYTVYLKDPPQTSYYQTTQTIAVASGFVPKGQFATETKDFTAPEGYKQLCVRINNKEECGFEQVSTSFAVNAIRDSAAADELARNDITSESTCISGGNNPALLLQPNIQAGVEDVVTPQAYDRGIVRICATANPGSETDPTRFVDVGYCSNTKIRCWLDKQSVDAAITQNNIGAKNSTLSEIEQIQKATLVNQGVIYRDDYAVRRLDELAGQVESLRVDNGQALTDAANIALLSIDNESDKFFYNHHKARLLLLRAEVYDIVTRNLFAQWTGRITSGTGSSSSGTNTGTSTPAVSSPSLGSNGVVDSGGFVGPPADAVTVPGVPGSDVIPGALRLFGPYDPAQSMPIYQDQKETDVYLKNNKVYYDVAWWPFNREIGVVQNGELSMLPSARSALPENLFDALAGAQIDGWNIVPESIQSTTQEPAPSTPVTSEPVSPYSFRTGALDSSGRPNSYFFYYNDVSLRLYYYGADNSIRFTFSDNDLATIGSLNNGLIVIQDQYLASPPRSPVTESLAERLRELNGMRFSTIRVSGTI